jgi:hypothetical protein
MHDLPIDAQVVLEVTKDGKRVVFRNDTCGVLVEQWDWSGIKHAWRMIGVEKVYDNGVFGGIQWSRDAKKVVFVGERKRERIMEVNGKLRKSERYEGQRSDFGEGLKGTSWPVIWVYDLENKKEVVIDLEALGLEELYPACPIFDKPAKGIVFHGIYWPIERMGLLYAFNRPTSLYYIPDYSKVIDPDLEDNAKIDMNDILNSESTKFTIKNKNRKIDIHSPPKIESKMKKSKLKIFNLTPNYYYAGYPKFSSDYKYLSFFSSKDLFHSHMTYLGVDAIVNLKVGILQSYLNK